VAREKKYVCGPWRKVPVSLKVIVEMIDFLRHENRR
jgi:hypothetical protein